MAEWVGQFIGEMPAWLVLPAALLVSAVVYIAYMWVYGGDVIDRWFDRKKREKELAHGKKKAR